MQKSSHQVIPEEHSVSCPRMKAQHLDPSQSSKSPQTAWETPPTGPPRSDVMSPKEPMPVMNPDAGPRLGQESACGDDFHASPTILFGEIRNAGGSRRAHLGRWARPLVLFISSVESQAENGTLASQSKSGKWLTQTKDFFFRALFISLLFFTPQTNE